jgi:prepilin-type N-terminal cleavage/methylation domain-containing protein
VKRNAGFSLIEVLVTMMIIATMVSTASMYYADVIQQTNRDKALSDLKQICKVLHDYDASFPSGLTTYTQISVDPQLRDLDKLVEARKMVSIPSDPWGNFYRIDIQAGIVYSQGQDFGKSFDHFRYSFDPGHKPPLPMSVEDAISFASMDDVIVRFRPPFKPVKAGMLTTKRAGKEVSIVNVVFSRAVSHTNLTTDTSFHIGPKTGVEVAPPVKSVVVDVLKRHNVNIILQDVLNKSVAWTVSTSSNGTIMAVDETELEFDEAVDIVPERRF